MKILLTGFEPFAQWKVNPSEQIVRALAKTQRSHYELIAEILPVDYVQAGSRIKRLIQKHKPDAVVCLGLAPERRSLSLERVALNLDDAPLPDNSGRVRIGRHILPDGPAAYYSTHTLNKLLTAFINNNLSVVVSNHAGTYLCNHVFYLARHEIERMGLPSPCGFIHLPGMPSARGKQKRLTLRDMTKAIELCLDALSRSRKRPIP